MVKKTKIEEVEFPVTNDIVFPDEDEVEATPVAQVTYSFDPESFTEVSYGIARKKVDLGTPNERVRSYLVEIRYNPETGDVLPAKLSEMDDISAAIREFKIKTVKNILKY